MMRDCLRALYLLVAVMVCPCVLACGTEAEEKMTCLELEVPVGPAQISVDLSLPNNKSPKALVLFVPGTGGLSDPYFDNELQQKNYDSQSRGGLQKLITNAGYAVAFYNQRGFQRLSRCVNGRDFPKRIESFVNSCIEGHIRKDVDLHTITDDTSAVISFLYRNKYTEALPQIVVAYSEGLYHVSSLVSSGMYTPLGIIGVGGPWESLSDTLTYQFTKEYYTSLVERALRACPGKVRLEFSDLFLCSGDPYSNSVVVNVQTIFQGRALNHQNLQLVKQELQAYQKRGFSAFASVSSHATLNGMFHGALIPVAWSAKFYQQMFASEVRVVDQLANFKGPIILLYGGEDDLVRLPLNGLCGTSKTIRKQNCKSAIVEGTGHGLQDNSGKLGPHPLKIILDALNQIHEKK